MSDAGESSTPSDWFVPFEDESVYASTGVPKGQLGAGKWRPDANEVAALYGGLEAMGGVLPLTGWSWVHGRRPPSPKSDEEYESETDDAEGQDKSDKSGGDGKPSSSASNAVVADSGFDFEEEEAAVTPQRRPLSGQRELKGSAKKKTTDFKNVISNMQRHRQMDAANRAKQQQQQQQQQQQKQ